VAGLLGACILPDKPISTKWLTEAQQQLAVERIEADTVGLTENQGFRKTFKGLCTNWNLLTFVFLQMMHLSSVGFNNYFPTIIKSLGFSTQQSLYLTAPPFLLAVFVSYGAGLLSGWLNERTFIITASMVLAIIGFAMCGAVHNHSIRYLSTFLFTSGGYSVNCVILGWVSATLGQTQQHKALAYGMVNTMGNASYVYSSFLYRKDTEPQYEIAMYANVAFSFLVIVCTHILRWRLRKANRKIQEEEEVALANGQDVPRRLRYCY
jgi:MFS family permease